MINTTKILHKKTIKLIGIAIFIAIFLFYPIKNILAQSKEIAQKINEIKSVIQKISEIKDSSEISDEKKSQTELQLKKKVLIDVIGLGKLQIDDIKEKLNSTSFPNNNDWNKIKDSLYKNLDLFIKYYNAYQSKINEDKEFNLDKIKTAAKEINDYKKSTIDPKLRQINDIAITFDISSILDLANERLQKINTDINKIYKKGLINDGILKNMFEKASKYLAGANSANNKAKSVILNFYTINTNVKSEILSSSSSSISLSTSTPEIIEKSTSTASTTEELINQKKDNFAKSLLKEMEKVASSTDNDTKEQTEEEKYRNNDLAPESIVSNYIRNMMIKSLEKVKDTYKIFIDMSTVSENILNK